MLFPGSLIFFSSRDFFVIITVSGGGNALPRGQFNQLFNLHNGTVDSYFGSFLVFILYKEKKNITVIGF